MTFQSTIVQKKLEDAGFDQKQAFGLAAVLEADVVADLEARFVTREYLDARLAELKAELKSEMSRIESEIKTEIGGIKVELMTQISGNKVEIKTEISGNKAELMTQIGGIKVEMMTQIGGIKVEMIKWMAGMIGGSTLAIIIAILRLTK